MIEIAGLVVAGVSALGSLVQAYYTAKSQNRVIPKSSLTKANDRAAKPLKIGVKTVSEVIDDQLLTALNNEIEKHHRELILALTTADDEKQAEKVEEARAQICKFLANVMSFNEGRLPTKRLEKLWLSNRCQNITKTSR